MTVSYVVSDPVQQPPGGPMRDEGRPKSEPFGLIDGVAKSFGTGNAAVPALERVDHELRRGDLVSLLGPSGCGKTTLLRIIAGLVPPSSGRVVIDGRSVQGPQPDFGFVFQAPTLLPWRTVKATSMRASRGGRHRST